MTEKETRDEAERILSRAGYVTRYGGDGFLHIVPKSGSVWGTAARGTAALCGATASRRDYKNEKPPCQECLRKVVNCLSCDQPATAAAKEVL